MSSSRLVSSLLPHCRHNLIGMVHVAPLPGSPNYKPHSWPQVLARALDEARLLDNLDMDGIIVENMGDVPYLLGSKVDALTVACMTTLCTKIREVVSKEKPVGVQILAGANLQAMAVAKACQLQLVRAENFIFGHVADEGLMGEASAGELLRFRRMADAIDVAVWADLKKKHASHALTADVDLGEMCRAADFCGADAVIVTGAATGAEADVADVALACNNNSNVVVGSGVNADNVNKYGELPLLAYIVGSGLKHNDHFRNNLDPERVRSLVQAVKVLRSNHE